MGCRTDISPDYAAIVRAILTDHLPDDAAVMRDAAAAERFIAQWRDTGGSELANTQSFINGP